MRNEVERGEMGEGRAICPQCPQPENAGDRTRMFTLCDQHNPHAEIVVYTVHGFHQPCASDALEGALDFIRNECGEYLEDEAGDLTISTRRMPRSEYEKIGEWG